MPDLLGPFRDGLRRVPVALRSAHVLRQAGLTHLGRPDEAVRSLLLVRRLGPFAGAVAIAARRDPDAVGLADERGELTFRELDGRSNALARAWRAAGIGPRHGVGVLCRNHRGLLDAVLAAAKIGARAVLLNTGFAARQLADVAAREELAAVVYDEEFTPVVEPLPERLVRYLGWVDDDAERDGAGPVSTLDGLIERTDDADLPAPDRPGGIVLLTSGTTGTPKGAPRQVRSALSAAEFLDRVPYRRREATLIAAPLFHGTGLSQLVLQLALASTTVLTRRFEPEWCLALVEKHRCTGLVLIPTLLQRILDSGAATVGSYDTSSLRIVFSAGSALSPELGNRAMTAFGDVVYNLYGSTEVAVATVATPEDWRRAPGTVGRPPVGCRVRLYDDAGRRITEPYRRGRIFAGSGLAFGGYTGGGTREDIGGLLHTGDVGHVDADGLLFIDGRSDDMIVSGGENVYPTEVENLLVEHDTVSDAAVVGVPDEEFGQRLRAYVVASPGAEVSAEEIREFVKGHLARFKVPRDVVVVDELPRNPTGKVLRNRLG